MQIGVVEFDNSGRPSEQNISSDNFKKMKEISDDIVSHFIRTSNGYDFGLPRHINYFASALTSLALSQKNLLIKEITNLDNFRIYSAFKDRLMEVFQLDNPNIINLFGKNFAIAVIIADHHTSLSKRNTWSA